MGYKSCGPILLYDLSLPLKDYYVLVDLMREHLRDISPRVFGYGHLGNIKFNTIKFLWILFYIFKVMEIYT